MTFRGLKNGIMRIVGVLNVLDANELLTFDVEVSEIDDLIVKIDCNVHVGTNSVIDCGVDLIEIRVLGTKIVK